MRQKISEDYSMEEGAIPLTPYEREQAQRQKKIFTLLRIIIFIGTLCFAVYNFLSTGLEESKNILKNSYFFAKTTNFNPPQNYKKFYSENKEWIVIEVSQISVTSCDLLKEETFFSKKIMFYAKYKPNISPQNPYQEKCQKNKNNILYFYYKK